MSNPKTNRLHAGAKITDARSKRVSGAVTNLLKLLEDKQQITKEKARMILDSCSDLRDPDNPNQRYVPCQGAECPPPKFFAVNKRFGEVYATVPEIGKDGKATGKTTVGRCVPVDSVRPTDRKKIELEERIRNILRRLEPVLPKIQKLTDFANAVESCSTFKTEEMCRQPTIGNDRTPKCFPEKDAQNKLTSCVDSTAYALAKTTGFKEKLASLEADLVSITAQLAQPQFNLFGQNPNSAGVVPRDPKRRSVWRQYQNLTTRQTSLRAQIERLIHKSDTVNQALESGLQNYNQAKGIEEICQRTSSETYGSCIDGSAEVCMVVQPGKGSNAGYIYTTTADNKKKSLGDAKCLPVVGRDRTFVYNDKTGYVHHLAADGRETTLSKTNWDSAWASAASYIPGGKWISSTISGYRPGIDDNDEWMAQIGQETTRLQAMMYKLDTLHKTIQTLLKNGNTIVVTTGEYPALTTSNINNLLDDAWLPNSKNNMSDDGTINTTARYVKLYNDATRKYNRLYQAITTLQNNLKESAPSETTRIQNILLGSSGLSDDVKNAVFKSSEDEMRAQLAHTIAVHKNANKFVAGELVTYQFEGDRLIVAPGWTPANKKDMTGIVVDDFDGSGTKIKITFDNNMTFEVDANHVGKYYQDIALTSVDKTDDVAKVLSGTTDESAMTELAVYVNNTALPDAGLVAWAKEEGATLMNLSFKTVGSTKGLRQLAEDAENASIVRRTTAGTIGYASRAGTYLTNTFSGMFNYVTGGASSEEEFMSTDGDSDMSYLSSTDGDDISLMSTELGQEDHRNVDDISLMSTELGQEDHRNVSLNDVGSVDNISLMSTDIGSERSFDVNRLYEEYYSNGDTASIASSVSHL